MRTLRCLALFAVCATPTLAAADLPPSDLCHQKGESCANAGTFGTLPGKCLPSQCGHYNVQTGETQWFDCLRCTPIALDAAREQNCDRLDAVCEVEDRPEVEGHCRWADCIREVNDQLEVYECRRCCEDAVVGPAPGAPQAMSPVPST